MKITRLFDAIYYQLEQFPQEKCLIKKVNNSWTPLSTKEVIAKTNNLSLGLLEHKIDKGDKVAIVSFNCPEWILSDLAIQQIGAVSVPMYPTITSEDYNYIFKDANVKLVIVQNKELLEKVQHATKDIEGIEAIYTIDEIEGTPNLIDLEKEGQNSDKKDSLESRKNEVSGEDLLTLIYTSGTTGNPKGVMLTHNNLVSNTKASSVALACTEKDSSLSFLPLCHVFERTVSYVYLSKGISIHYAENMETIGENLKEVKPHVFTTVPRLLEKVYDKIYAKGLELTGIKRNLFFWALNLGMRYDLNKNQGAWYNFQLDLANKIIFSKWREALGGNVRQIVSGSAALQPRLATVFNSAGIRIMEGYGLTETSPVISVNRFEPEGNRVGTVGPLIDGVQVKIAEDGEILTKGPHIMKGYYNNPEATKETIDAEGWLHTGDIGELVEGKFLKITDRKKEIFKTSGGKYVAPQVLENKFKESIFIEQIMIVGEGQKFPGALIIPNFTALEDYCKYKDVAYSTHEEMVTSAFVVKKFQKEIDKLNKGFAKYEQVKQYKILPFLWTIEEGELTPTMKCKRKVILKKYEEDIRSIYKDDYVER